MALNLCCFVISYSIFFQLSLFVSSHSVTNIKPQILEQYETIVENGQNFTAICQGNTSLSWEWPFVNETSEYSKWTKITTTNVLPQNGTYQFGSRIFITNLTYPFTGFYKCIPEGIDASDEDYTDSMYLYVKDETHLSVNNEELDTVIVTQYTDAVIPCRPTSPDVDVELALVTGEKKPKPFLGTLDEEGILYRYDPRYGFITNKTTLPETNVYICTFTIGPEYYSKTVVMDVEPMIHEIPRPILEEISGGHTVVGEQLVLECKIRTQTSVKIEWITPTGLLDPDRTNTSSQMKDPYDSSLILQRLTIHKATLDDRGLYHCNVSDHQNHHSIASLNVTVYNTNDHFINLTEENNLLTISTVAGRQPVQWRIDVRGHPIPTLFWLNNNNEIITSERTDKYRIKITDTDAELKIKNVEITDFGNYTLIAQNDFEEKRLVLFLNVTDKPSVHIEMKDFHMVYQKETVKCVVAAYPPPEIYWSFKPCLDNSCTFEPLNETRSLSKGFRVTSFVSIKSLNSGYIKCFAQNSVGEDYMIRGYHVTDVENGFDIFGFEDTVNVNGSHVEVAVGETIKITCGVSIYNFTSNIKWIHNSLSDERYRVDKSRTEYSNRRILNIDSVDFSDSGDYSCQVQSKTGGEKYKNLTIVVSEPVTPAILRSNLQDREITLPNKVDLFCSVRGIPKPTVTWYKDDERILSSNVTQFGNHNQNMTISSLDYNHEGIYKCVATNKAGTKSQQMKLTVKNKPVVYKWLIWVIFALILLLAALIFFFARKIRNEKRFKEELRIAGLANFEKGAVESLNQDLPIDDQAELLPYDKKWEFPIEKLKLGKQLGSGAFGVVMKGVAKGIVEGEESTTVAVKMVKKTADNIYIKALASELKIMVHLGKHLNVVNLLGACTKNVAKKELLVIVEYCRFGNLQNYLLRHRESFIDQVDPKCGSVDYTIGQEFLERTYSVSSNRSNNQSPYMKYAALSFSNSSGNQPLHMVDYRGDNYHGTTAKTDITLVSMSPATGDEEIMLSNNSSVQPEWRSNYHGDYKTGNIQPICTKDLLAWAFQVSRGMEYLASRKVLHGDLAARNILLADNNVVKICDFGLAKSMYKSDNYKKKGDGPLPVKWMAIESIRDKMFSTQSDVWSFGIVLWEFFSLAKTPYPGMEADERLYSKLLDGYRMESPEYAPKEIYKMMCDCWHAKPLSRPTFTKLSERIGSLLEDTVRKHYIDLNDPYLVMNTQRLEDGHSDYLAMLSPPDFENLSSPHHYMNDLPQQEETPGYLPMNSAHIFSPRPDDDHIFSFDIGGNKARRGKNEEGGAELLPMLSRNNESDCDSSTCGSPMINSVSNPTYHLPPVVEKNQFISDNDNIVKSVDNYVNMPQNKSVMKDSNPFLAKMDKNVRDVHYVNSNSRDWESVQL